MIFQESAANVLPLRNACNELSRRLRAGETCGAQDFFDLDPSLGDDPDAALELLYTEFVVRDQLGQQPRPEDFLDRFPEWRAELEELFEVHRLIAEGPTQHGVLLDTRKDAASAAAFPELGGACREGAQVGGYELLEEIGRGGMGIVYKARQRGLARIVALKMILPPHGPRERARFRTEAESTASLSHPNIVQVYEVGQEDNLPFLSMEFIAGKSLDKQLAAAVLSPRAAAELLFTLSRAVSYAHDHGIIHRDLKPANIVIAGDGTPKITDFGLARQLLPQDGPQDSRQSATQTGAIIGTPSYMAPEQCRSSGASPAADIYSLGAILYEALTGRPPFRGQSALDILELVRSQEPVAPHRLVPKVPRDLETICLKCLAKQPEQRYGSATALAEDLRHFLAGEPILARPVGRTERALRWCRRNPAVASLMGGIALALIVGTTVSTALAVWALNEKQRASEHAHSARTSAQQEHAARELAEYRFSQAEKAVEEYLDGVEANELLKQADFFDLRKQLLASALPFYEDFIKAKPGDTELETKRGKAHYRLADLRRQLGERGQALADFRQALAIFQKLADDSPDDPQRRQLLARGHTALGNLLREMGKPPDEAMVEVRRAIEMQEALITEFPAVPSYRNDLAKSRHHLGMLLYGLGSNEQAETEYREAFKLNEPLAADFPSVPGYRRDLSGSHNNMANVLMAMGKKDEAVEEMRQALALKQALVAEFPKVATYRSDLAVSQYNLGSLASKLRKWDVSAAAYREAADLRQALAAEFPAVFAYRLDLGRSRYYLARALRDNNQLEEAEVEYRAALDERIKLTADFPDIPDCQADLADSHAGLGSLLYRLGNRPDAIAEFERSVKIRTPLLEQFPEVSSHRSNIASHVNTLGILLRDEGQLAEARRMHDLAIEHRRYLLQAAPKNRTHAASLRGYYSDLADTLLVAKDHAEAAKTAALIASVRPDVAGDSYWAARYLGRCVTLAEADAGLSEAERQSLALSYTDQAMNYLREAVRRGYVNVAEIQRPEALAPLRGRPDYKQLVSLLPPVEFVGAKEGEELEILNVTTGTAGVQLMTQFTTDHWSGDQQLYWLNAQPGARLDLAVSLDAGGTHDLEFVFTKARDYGIVQLSLDGVKLGEPVDLFHPTDVFRSGVLKYNLLSLAPGRHVLSFQIVGANPEATKDYMFGLDYIRFVPVPRSASLIPNP